MRKSPHAPRRPRKLIGLLLLAVGLIGSLLSVTSVAAQPARNDNTKAPKPTVVLVHGAFADASSWNGVIGRLRRDGFPVIAPANPERDLAGDSAYIASVMATISGPIILVGHSYGGAVITNAAIGSPNVKALVYIAGFALAPGESLLDINMQYPNSQLASATLPRPYPLPDGTSGTDLYISPDKFQAVFAQDLSSATTATLAATQRPLSFTALTDKSAGAAWQTIPSWYMVATKDHAIDPAAERAMAARAGAHTVEVSSSHAVLISHASAVTNMIEAAARAAA